MSQGHAGPAGWPGAERAAVYLASVAALHVWDHDRRYQLLARFVRLARAAGSLSELPSALTARVFALLSAGELAAAAALADELEAVAEATGASRAPFTALGVAALRGDEGAFPALFQAVTRDAGRRGEGYVLTVAGWAAAILGNGLG